MQGESTTFVLLQVRSSSQTQIHTKLLRFKGTPILNLKIENLLQGSWCLIKPCLNRNSFVQCKHSKKEINSPRNKCSQNVLVKENPVDVLRDGGIKERRLKCVFTCKHRIYLICLLFCDWFPLVTILVCMSLIRTGLKRQNSCCSVVVNGKPQRD